MSKTEATVFVAAGNLLTGFATWGGVAMNRYQPHRWKFLVTFFLHGMLLYKTAALSVQFEHSSGRDNTVCSRRITVKMDERTIQFYGNFYEKKDLVLACLLYLF